ncbi:hypothetical protein B0H14DRAFT_1361135 [Mycena olivaceomarginata]|nr:hypothetical protein B0H14DRAFT_1361135 [Mycena olivaceomarginata]
MTPTISTKRALTLPNDILDRIFQCAPDFQTLSAAIRVSKAWHHVFQTHPKSIVRLVTQNVVIGPLPDALRVLRYFSDQETNEENGEITAEELQRLQKNAAVVEGLEAAFSLKHRDPLLGTSQLNSAESWRFARAIHRIMLYCAVFRLPDDEDQLHDVEEYQRDKIEAQRIAMLSEYSTQDLFELNGAVVFLRALAYESTGNDQDDDDEELNPDSDMLIATGPAAVLKAHRHGDIDAMLEIIGSTVWNAEPSSLLEEFFRTPLQKIWATRQVTPPPNDETALQDILLDDVTYRSAPCDQCGTVGATKLRHEDNWADLHLNIRALLLGNLSGNFIEMEPLEEVKPERDIPKLISELYALKTEEFKDWNKSDAVCNACFTKFVSAHLHLWLLDYKLKDGWEAPKDCWYGYKCRTQTEVTLHAMTKNHLCAPTKPCN